MTKANFRFPDALRVIVADSKTGERLSRMAVMLTVNPPARNPYRVLVVTDDDGVALLGRAHVERTIDRSRRNFLMDYEGKLEECSREVDLEVLSREHVERAIGAMERYEKHFEVDLELLASLRAARNGEIHPAAQRLTIDAPSHMPLEFTIQVSKKPVPV